jgi:glutamyl-Q tRNA(Asp) synthetase
MIRVDGLAFKGKHGGERAAKITAMAYIGRFAPSPTGDLHDGSLLAAVGSFLRARQQGGAWMLRIEDIDPPREVAGSAAGILATLGRLGLHADAPPLFQSTRGKAYRAAFEALRARDKVFPCWCTRSDLAAHGGLHRDARCVGARVDGREPAWRLRTGDECIAFVDGVMGPQEEHLRDTAGDFVVLRADGLWSYQLACVVDDAAQGITEVVRGQDLLDSTARQIHLQRLLGLPTPAYLHLPLLRDAAGRKLAKSTGAPAIDRIAPAAALQQTFGRLGVEAVDAGTPASMLARAASRFDPRRMAPGGSHIPA